MENGGTETGGMEKRGTENGGMENGGAENGGIENGTGSHDQENGDTLEANLSKFSPPVGCRGWRVWGEPSSVQLSPPTTLDLFPGCLWGPCGSSEFK